MRYSRKLLFIIGVLPCVDFTKPSRYCPMSVCALVPYRAHTISVVAERHKAKACYHPSTLNALAWMIFELKIYRFSNVLENGGNCFACVRVSD